MKPFQRVEALGTTQPVDPSSSAQAEDTSYVALDNLPNGSRAEVVGLRCGQGAARKLAELGIFAGAALRVQRSAPLGGPILVEVQGSMVALGRRLAHRVFMRRLL